ncbi:MAG TPA: Fe-S cluster assembly protein SufD [Bryobacteraceae bacterium]|nr:Fe-S cluster assembly protein SufD [Bryobacteraceae bacterium]
MPVDATALEKKKIPANKIDERQAAYLSAFEQSEDELARVGSPRLRELRRTAIESFAELGFPTPRDEDWKFTNISPLTRLAFHPPLEANAEVDDAAQVAGLIQRLPRDEYFLVFINGRYAPTLSSELQLTTAARTGPVSDGFPAGGGKDRLIVTGLRDAFTTAGSLCEPHIGRYADYRKHAFIALNTAFLDDGAFVHIPNDMVVERPIHLIYVSLPGSQPQVCHPRNLIVIGARSQASLIESYIGPSRLSGEPKRTRGSSANQSPYFTNAVTEISGGEDAICNHYKLQQESPSAFHVATLQVEQGRGFIFKSQSFSFGGSLTRNEINSVLAEGSECTLNGLYVVSGRQHVDTHTSIDHAKPHAASHELYKGILNGQSSAVFNGKIIVRKDAQKTDAKQTNKNLVLSEESTINTKPELQIYADDVRCTHGATIGQLDEEAIFYLQSRGIARESAREMLTEAFAGEIVDRVGVESLRNYFHEALKSRLVKEAG